MCACECNMLLPVPLTSVSRDEAGDYRSLPIFLTSSMGATPWKPAHPLTQTTELFRINYLLHISLMPSVTGEWKCVGSSPSPVFEGTKSPCG